MSARPAALIVLASLLLLPPVRAEAPGAGDAFPIPAESSPGGGEQCGAFENRGPGVIVASATCGGCHERAYEEHATSAHATSASDDIFVAEFTRVLASGDAPWDCLTCHAPTVLAAIGNASLAPGLLESGDLPGVTCEVCHSSVGYLGPEPGGGNLAACPGEPRSVGRGHSRVETFQRGSELCAACHQWENVHGVVVLDTHREWMQSAEARRGVQCQDCHASPSGFLIDGRSLFTVGKIAGGADARETPVRSRVHSHEYPGASWPVQVRSALELEILPLAFEADGRLRFDVSVRNAGAAHAVPTGWTALRLLWLEVEVDGVALPASPTDPDRPWDVAGAMIGDSLLDELRMPVGSRLFRAVFLDLDGQATSDVWNARSLAFDNRLGPGEVRRESHEISVSPRRSHEVTARLRYVSRPQAWSEARGLPPARVILVAERSLRMPGH